MIRRKILLAAGLISVTFSAFAADQVVKEKTTPTAPAGAITAEQIPPLYTTPASIAPAPKQPTEINQPVAPSNVSTPPPAAPPGEPATTPAQPSGTKAPAQPETSTPATTEPAETTPNDTPKATLPAGPPAP